jgi:hypothetical protein
MPKFSILQEALKRLLLLHWYSKCKMARKEAGLCVLWPEYLRLQRSFNIEC